jgi:BNR repeat-like domain/BNR/Asp-box repeat
MKHITVFGEPATYAGWPANHGSWQWGDEFLVGFMTGRHVKHRMHNIEEPFSKLLARSTDGGETWKTFKPNVDFEARQEDIIPYAPPKSSDLIYRFCGRYDHGGEYCAKYGGCYRSEDRGATWSGPYQIGSLPNGFHFTSRTCVLDDLIFISVAKESQWGSDGTLVGRLENGMYRHVATVLDDEYRAVMPAAAKVHYPLGNEVGSRIIVCLRRRGAPRRGGWIDAVHSDDGGKTWSKPVHVADTGIHNGNPPALVERDGIFYCAYANRTDCKIWVSFSQDYGLTWTQLICLRSGECSDIGYPRLFKRDDGQLVCVYYWSDAGETQRIEATVFP